MLSDEIALNLKLSKETNDQLHIMYNAIEKTSKSVGDEKSTSHILEMLHQSQDTLADDTSELFTSIGDLLYRYKHIVGMFLDYDKNQTTIITLTVFDIILWGIQLVLFITLLLVTIKIYSQAKSVL